MAATQALFSGTVRFSSTTTSGVWSRAYSATITCSTWQAQEIVLLPTASDFVVSIATLSNVQALLLMATNTCRVNFAGLPSSVSAGSAGFQFKDLFAVVGSGISGTTALRFANSAADSCTVTVIMGQ